ncbi:hypothetical protein Pmar_PMAR007034 [Perkinsus marinus ATCC 50983]|uniref:Uncharacterized protein n=1 Tax=Perkinsus marinus (strain ATCC 50983 / TXsc) TaxID=423536 RepID=C5KZL0_PERM5|nr:hypothetical protein Pmar_PMAR007034 [Perkinsus marinus ATCC 50983]EER10038.1 hypothetical protein Pmar_PMAR007034 [Perkinsus marinus ATCC 50983]|eukprot:XP_002778243.1 hypothetical protein Pmar_PMAR007034 [Perkinsus marinus ATCC 50983]
MRLVTRVRGVGLRYFTSSNRESGRLKRLSILQRIAAREDLHDKLAANSAMEDALRCIQEEMDQLSPDILEDSACDAELENSTRK